MGPARRVAPGPPCKRAPTCHFAKAMRPRSACRARRKRQSRDVFPPVEAIGKCDSFGSRGSTGPPCGETDAVAERQLPVHAADAEPVTAGDAHGREAHCIAASFDEREL